MVDVEGRNDLQGEMVKQSSNATSLYFYRGIEERNCSSTLYDWGMIGVIGKSV